jgi:hypothetical protein
MRSVAEYLHKAAEFDALAARGDVRVPLKNRYVDLLKAIGYWLKSGSA